MYEAMRKPPPDPLLRFRLRTIMALTSALALAATVAAPYFRSQSPNVQSNLLLFWSTSLQLIGVAFAARLWLVSRVPAAAGPVYFWARLRWPLSFDTRVRPLLVFALFAISIFATVNGTQAVVRRAQMSSDLKWGACSLQAVVVSLIVSGFAVAISSPIALCERGIPIHGSLTGWQLIRDAKWEPDRYDVLRLRGAHWSIFVEISIADRDRVELFVRDKIAEANVANGNQSRSPTHAHRP